MVIRVKLAVAIIIIAVAVVVVIVVQYDGKGQPLTSNLWDECFGDTGTLWGLNVRLKERQDFSKFADITLCPRSTMFVDGFQADPLDGSLPPMNLQSNMRICCGSNGALSNRCAVTGKDSTPCELVVNSPKSSGEEAAMNVTI